MSELEQFSINPAMNPQSVALIGASATEGKMGYKVLKNIIDSGYQGKLFPINPKGDVEEILGYPVFKSVLDVPDDIDMALFMIPSKVANAAAEECGQKGVKTLCIISAGFKEVGGEGVELESELKEIGKKYNMRIIGPNCLGIVNFQGNFTFAKSPSEKGSIAMISQSGAMATALLDWSIGRLGFSAFISLGNKADVDETDFIEYLGADPQTKVIIGYVESIEDGPRFLKICGEVTQRKPVILIKGGRSAAGAKAASSHTGALAGSDEAVELAFKKCGVIRAYTIADLFNYAAAFVNAPIPKGAFYAIVTNAGGPGIVTTDAISENKLGWAHFPEELEEALKGGLPAEANIHNPVDIVGDAPPEQYEFALDTVLAST